MTARLHRQTAASALISAAVAASVLTILVAGFVTYMANEYLLNFHSHAWTQALHLSEAAIETGFAEFNYQYFQGGSGFQSSRGWSGSGGTYTKSVTDFTDSTGKVLGSFTVTVSGVGSSSPAIQGVGTASLNRGPATISRAVRVGLATSSRFPAGITSKNRIDLNGNNVYSDSYDSSDPAKSTNGGYDSTKRQPNGDIASDEVLIDSVDIGNAAVYGKVYTGSAGTVEIGANGSVGNTFVNADRATTVTQGETAGYIRHDFNVDIPDSTLPSDATGWSSLGSINNNTAINGGDWRVSKVDLAGSDTLTIQGNVRLYITGDTSLSGLAQIIISSNSTLTVYAAGSMSIHGNGVQNSPGFPTSNQFFGLSSSTAWDIAGNGNWIGTVYAPAAALTIGGNGTIDGAIVAKSITLTGNANFHYDESLKTAGGAVGYVVSSWQELRNVDGVWAAN